MNDVFSAFEQLPWLFYAMVVVFSLMIGSFLNVVIYRLPIMMEREWKRDFCEYFNHPELLKTEDKTRFNLAFPGSHCPKCDAPVRWFDNLPVVSWLLLQGKCRHCRAPISIRYPLIELLTAVVALMVALRFGVSEQSLWAIALSMALIALTFIDFDKMLLPDQIIFPFLWLGLLLNLSSTFVDIESAILGAIIGYLCLWSIYWLFKLATGKEGMGYGDFKLLALLGAWLGWQHLPLIILGSSVVGAVLGLAIMSVRGKEKSGPMPFGPYLAIAGWIALMWGEQIQSWYITSVLGL